ncbi:MAG: hypothetical protein ACYC99_10420 [Candidatus Geothermincolia bacterium]
MPEESKFDDKTVKGAKFCLDSCPMCKIGRNKGKGFMYKLLHLEAKVCPKCKDYEKVYGVPAWEKPPA